CRANRCADFRQEPMRFAEFALAGGAVAGKPRQLGALDVEKGLVALRARHLEPGGGFGERCLDRVLCLPAPVLAECAHPGEQSRKLPDSAAASTADGDRFLYESQGLYAVAEAEMRRRHHPEHPAFIDLRPSFRSNR